MPYLAKLFGGGILGGATAIGKLFVRWHSDAVRGQAIQANLQHGAEAINGSIAKVLIRTGKGADEAPVLVYEWLRDAAMVVVIYDLAMGNGSKLLGYFL